MTDFRIGYLYSLAPIHCGGEGDLGNILEISREAHTDFPYIPGSSLRGSLRNEVTVLEPDGQEVANRLFGKELDDDGQMGVHQVWFGDARLLWVPMRTMALKGGNRDVFTWVSCHSLIRDHALIAHQSVPRLRNRAVGTTPGVYLVADAELQVSAMTDEEKLAVKLSGDWAANLQGAVQSSWEGNHIILPDSEFQILMEHSLWTQVRNKIQESDSGKTQAGSAEVFWTDVCIPRDTIFYFSWGYSLTSQNPVTDDDHDRFMEIMGGLLQVGGQANVGRGWVQSWVASESAPEAKVGKSMISKEVQA